MAAPILKNRAGVSCATAGTGTLTLGAALGAVSINQASWQTFATSGVADTNVVRYLILDSNGAWEYGTGTYSTAGTTLTRTLGASSTGSLLSLSGSSQVFIAAIGEDIVPFDSTTGTVTATLGVITGSTATTSPSTGTLVVTGGLAAGADIFGGNRLGLGASPRQNLDGADSSFQIQDSSGRWSLTSIEYGNNAFDTGFGFAKTRGAGPTTHVILNANDIISEFTAYGSDGTAYRQAAQITYVLDGNAGGGSMPGRINFSTTPSGSTLVILNMSVRRTGALELYANIASVSPITGTIVVTGGVGISGDFYGGGIINGILVQNLVQAVSAVLPAATCISPTGYYEIGNGFALDVGIESILGIN